MTPLIIFTQFLKNSYTVPDSGTNPINLFLTALKQFLNGSDRQSGLSAN